MIKHIKDWNFKTIAIVLAFIAVALLIASFLVPPMGVIDASVLTAAGEIVGMIAIFFGWEAIDRGLDAKITHRDTTIEIINDDDKEDKE